MPTRVQHDRPRILLVTRGYTHPPTIGGRQRNLLLLNALREIGEVDLVVLDRNLPDIADERYMRERHGLVSHFRMAQHADLTPWRWIRPLHPAFVQRLAHNVGRRARLYRPHPPIAKVIDQLHSERRYDLVVGRYLLYAMTAGLHRMPRSVLDVDDVDTEVYRSRLIHQSLSGWRRWVLHRHLRQLENIVNENLPRFSALWVSNPDDRELPKLERAQVLVNLPLRGALGEAAPGGSSGTQPARPRSLSVLGITRLMSTACSCFSRKCGRISARSAPRQRCE